MSRLIPFLDKKSTGAVRSWKKKEKRKKNQNIFVFQK